MRRAVLVAVLLGTPAHAGPAVTAEAGAELDSNVQRVETGPGLPTSRIAAYVLRLGARVDHKGKVLGGAYAVNFSDLTRIVSEASVENVTVLAGNLRLQHALRDREGEDGLIRVLREEDERPLPGRREGDCRSPSRRSGRSVPAPWASRCSPGRAA